MLLVTVDFFFFFLPVHQSEQFFGGNEWTLLSLCWYFVLTIFFAVSFQQPMFGSQEMAAISFLNRCQDPCKEPL